MENLAQNPSSLTTWKILHKTLDGISVCNDVGSLFRVFFRSIGNLRVWIGMAKRPPPYPGVGIISSTPYPHSVGKLITREGHVELCLRQVFRDLVSLRFRWIRLDLADFHGLRSFHMPLLMPEGGSWLFKTDRGSRSLARPISSPFSSPSSALALTPSTCHAEAPR